MGVRDFVFYDDDRRFFRALMSQDFIRIRPQSLAEALLIARRYGSIVSCYVRVTDPVLRMYAGHKEPGDIPAQLFFDSNDGLWLVWLRTGTMIPAGYPGILKSVRNWRVVINRKVMSKPKHNPKSEASRKKALRHKDDYTWTVAVNDSPKGDQHVLAIDRQGDIAAQFSLKSTVTQRAPLKGVKKELSKIVTKRRK